MSSKLTIVKQPSNRRSFQTSIQRGSNAGLENLSAAPWLESGLTEALYPGAPPSQGPDFEGLVCQFPHMDEPGFNDWDPSLQPFSPSSLDSLVASSVVDAAAASIAPSITDNSQDSEEVEDENDVADAMSTQLTLLSRNARQAMRRLARRGRTPLTVSSPEVNEALESTNILIRIIHIITARDRANTNLDFTTDYGLAFSTLASHQNVIALFRAICDAISRCLQSMKDHQHNRRDQQYVDGGVSTVAQFVMVLQLLLHLINRMDRSLFQQSSSKSDPGQTTPISPGNINHNALDALQSGAMADGSSPHGSLRLLPKGIVAVVADEHEKLRQGIRKLQTEMEQSELY